MPNSESTIRIARTINSMPIPPSQITPEVGLFDRFAEKCARLVSRAPFFAICVLMVVLWISQGLVIVIASGDWSKLLDSSFQLEINTTTTIITFLMVALLQNAQTRSDQALQRKLNAISEALADLMEEEPGMEGDIRELRAAVGLEERESTGKG